jgi:hypothetical protein
MSTCLHVTRVHIPPSGFVVPLHGIIRHGPESQRPWLPVSLLQALGARMRAGCVEFSRLGRQNGTH